MTDQLDTEKKMALALKKLRSLQLRECMDPQNLESRPYPKQDEIFSAIADYPIRAVVAGNQSGKSSIGGREISWLVEGTHPYYKMPRPDVKIAVIGRTTKHTETELWRDKIKPFLQPGTYKEVRTGNALQFVEFDNGSLILFMSHHNTNEAREKVQGFVLDYILMDEMTDSVSLLAELAMRVQARSHARMLLTFTPLLRSQEVKRWIESLTLPVGGIFRLNMLDNPIYAGREDEILQRFVGLSDSERRARLYGEWFLGDQAVYDFRIERHCAHPPEYHPSWRHIEAVDPAASGKTGAIWLAENPANGQWFVVREEYIKGAAASDLLPQLRSISDQYNICRRVCDPHEVWFLKEASKQGITYAGVYKKNERKKELIKQLQEVLNEGKLMVAPWCADLQEEFTTCQWAENGAERIVGASRFHLLDALQYAIDNLPKYQPGKLVKTFEQALKMANRERKAKEMRGKVRKGQYRPKIQARRGRRIV